MCYKHSEIYNWLWVSTLSPSLLSLCLHKLSTGGGCTSLVHMAAGCYCSSRANRIIVSNRVVSSNPLYIWKVKNVRSTCAICHTLLAQPLRTPRYGNVTVRYLRNNKKSCDSCQSWFWKFDPQSPSIVGELVPASGLS